MHKGLIVNKFANQVVPVAFFQAVLKEHNGSFGASVVTKDDAGKLGFVSMKMGNPADLDGLDQLQQTFLDDNVLMFFGASTNKVITPESQQPFDLLLNKDGEPLLMGFIEGTFPGYAEEKSAHSDAFFMVEKYLRTKLAKIYRYSDGDMAKVLEELRDPTFKQEIANTMTERGQVSLLSITGDVVSFTDKNTALIQFPWGWSSASCGYTEQQVADTKKSSMMASMVSRTQKQTPAPATKTEEKPVIQTVPNVSAPTTETAVKPAPRMVKAPMSIPKGKKLKRWYNVNAGWCPPNFNEYPEVESRVHQTLSDISPSQIQTSPSVTDTSAHHIPAKSERAEAEKVAAPEKPVIRVPLMTDSKQSVLEAFRSGKLKKTLDKNSNEIVPPSEIQKMEKRLPDFAKQVGMDGLEPTFQWGYQEVLDNLDKEAIAVLWFSTRSSLINSYTENGALRDKLNKAEAQVKGQATKIEKTQTPTTSTKADPAPAPAPAPAQTGLMSHMVSRRKVA